MSYTLGTAAKAVGKSKATISKAIKSGKISATKHDNGSYTIDPAELHRVYPPTPSETVDGEQSDTPTRPVGRRPSGLKETPETALLQVKLEAAQKRIEDLEEDRDQWRQQANRLLSHSPPQQAVTQPKGFWKRLFGD